MAYYDYHLQRWQPTTAGGHSVTGRTDLRDPVLSGGLAQVDARAARAADETAPLLDEESAGGWLRQAVARLTGTQKKFHVL